MRATVQSIDLNAVFEYKGKEVPAVKLTVVNQKGEVKPYRLAYGTITKNQAVLNTLAEGAEVDITFGKSNTGLPVFDTIVVATGPAPAPYVQRTATTTGTTASGKPRSQDEQIARSVALKGAIEVLAVLGVKEASKAVGTVLDIAVKFENYVLLGHTAPTTAAVVPKVAVKTPAEEMEIDEDTFD